VVAVEAPDAATHTDDPAAGWQGRIGRTLQESTPWWAPRAGAPAGAPDIVVLLLDDLGYSDFGCFGAEIRTAAIDRMAKRGVRFANYTTVPMCTPARAALLTGKNPHAVGCGWLTFNDPGFPGYRAGEMTRDTPTLAEILKANGYSTYMVGKWHNTPDHATSSSSDRSSWPLARGFDRFYGFLGGETHYFAPSQLVEDNTLLDHDAYRAGYYCTDDWTDKAIAMVKEHVTSSPGKPYFLYFAHNAPHAPLHAKAEDLARYRGVYDGGWDLVREARVRHQVEEGIFERAPALAPHSPGVPRWDDVDPARRDLMARYMELYAAVVDNIDQNVGRLMDTLEALGRLDNTLVLITSDNGANGIGGPEGAANNLSKRLTQSEDPDWVRRCFEAGELGGSTSWPTYPLGWTDVSVTPYRMYKTTTMNGGIRVPLVMQWPARWREGGRVAQDWVHVTDLAPTILDLVGIAAPAEHAGFRTRPHDGLSFKDTLDRGLPSRRDAQHFELFGNRGYIAEGWKIVSLQPPGHAIDLDNWMLFDLASDPTETHDLAREHPERLAALVAAFDRDAFANHVYPLDNRGVRRSLTVPPYLEHALDEPRTFHPGTGTAPVAVVAPMVADRSYRATCAFEWQPGASGVIFSLGDPIFGFALYAREGGVHFHYHGAPERGVDARDLPVAPGRNEFVLDCTATGARNAMGTLRLAGHEVATLDLTPTIILGISAGEGLDVGCDRRLHVTDYGGEGACRYSGHVHWVRIDPGPQAPGSYANRPERLSQRD
jgi:arylsulfatase A-like enzyme